MRVVRLRAGTEWTVYAVCDGNGDCPLLDFLLELDGKRRAKVLADLRDFVPATPTKEWTRIELSKPLTGTDGLFEFKWPTRGGGTPRVIWFYQPGKLVVCSQGHNKKGKLPQAELDTAASTKRLYEAAQVAGRIEVIDYEDFIAGDGEEHE